MLRMPECPNAMTGWARRMSRKLVSAFSAFSALSAFSGLAVRSAEAQAGYLVGVVSESGDIVTWLRPDGRGGLAQERVVPVGIMPADVDGPHNLAVAPDHRSYFVTIAHGVPFGTLWRFDARTDTVIGRAEVELFPTTIALSPDGEWAFVANSDFHGERPRVNPVSIVHAPSMTKVTDLAACDMPHGVRVNHAGTRVYVSCMHSDEILEIDAGSFDLLRRVKVGAGHAMPAGHAQHHPPAGAAAPPKRGTVVPATADTSKECAATFVAASPDDSRLYVACNYGNVLQVYDAVSLRHLKTIATGAGAYNVEPSPDGSRVIVTNKKDQSVSVIDARTLVELKRVPTSKKIVHGVAYAPDGRYAYISQESIGSDPGAVDVLDLSTLTMTGSVPVPAQPTGIAILKLETR
jgi:YVTN family beta-propeller protein